MAAPLARTRSRTCRLSALVLLVVPLECHAYIDPNIGGWLFQLLFPVLVAIGGAWMVLRQRIRALASKLGVRQRSLYFALAGLMRVFHLLHYGISAILVFVGGKMLAEDYWRIPTYTALTVIGAILAITILLSLVFPEKENQAAA